MPLAKQVVSWPLTGGIDTKSSPLALAPGSHLVLENVRQERTNEYRLRGGFGLDSADVAPGGLAPLKPVALPGGGTWAMRKETSVPGTVAPMIYTPSQGGLARWQVLQPNDSSQLTPGVWNRRAVMSSPSLVPITDYCEGAVFSLAVSCAPNTASDRGTTRVSVTSIANGDQIADTVFPGGLVTVNGQRPRCFVGPSGRLCLAYFDMTTGNPTVAQWDGSTGQSLGSAVVGVVGVIGAVYFFDAIYYGGSTITIVMVDGGAGLVRFIEYNPLTAAVATSVTLAGCAPTDCLALLAEPSGSGIRYIAWSSAAPTTNVTRVNNAGAIQTNEVVVAARSAVISGTACQGGVGWLVAYQPAVGPPATTANGISVVKKRSGAISAPLVLTPTTHSYRIASHPWLEAGHDPVRMMIAVNALLPDSQSTYFEIALPFEDGAAVTNLFPEPQARLLPLDAAPIGSLGTEISSHIPRPSRITTDTFVLALPRRIQFAVSTLAGTGTFGEIDLFAIDRWRVVYRSAGSVLNQGDGATTIAAAYSPAGSLLSSANGATVVAHGLSTLPFLPALTPGAGGALTVSKTYGYVVIVKTIDENGAVWRSAQSVAATVLLSAVQNRVSVAVKLGVTELARRIITVDIGRTQGDGSTFTVVNTRTGLASALSSFTYVDDVSDLVAQSCTAVSAEAMATITPAFSHVALFGGRLWGVERDFPNLWFSKPIVAGFQPEFPSGFKVPIPDAGDATGLAAMDDKLVIFKQNRRYVVTGDGPDNTGAGRLPSVQGLDSDLGAIVGSPLVSTLSEIFYVSQRGIQRMDRSLQDTFIGASVDRYLNQALVQAPAQVVGAVFSTKKNEVRFSIVGLTSGFEQLVFDRLRGIWYHDTSDPGALSVRSTLMGVPNSALWPAGSDPVQLVLLSDGSVLTEAPDTTGPRFKDGGFNYVGIIRSASIVPAGNDGSLRVYRAYAKGRQTVDAAAVAISPTLRIIYDDNDAAFEDFAPVTPIAKNTGPSELTWRGAGRPRRQKCSSFSLQLTIPNTDAETPATFRLDAWACEVGIKPGIQRLGSGERWT